MAKTTKPTKQQIAQAKARAGGNNPVKVTNAGLKKLGSAALIAASFTPVGRVAKVAATATKVSKSAKTAKKVAELESKIKKANSKILMNKASTMSPTSTGVRVRVSPDVSVRVKAKSNYELAKDFSNIGKIQKQNAGPLASRAEVKANARGLRAANKKTNKVGSKADKELRSRTKSVTLGKEETATLNDYYYGQPDMIQVMSRRTPVNEASSVRKFKPTPKKKSATQLRPKKK